MAVLFEDSLKKDISLNQFAPVYILFGNDSYLNKFYFDRLCEKTFDGDPFFNCMKFEADTDLQAVYDAVVQYPMMSDKKCVAITDFDFETASKDEFEKFCTVIENSGNGCTLIIRFDSVDFDFKKSLRAKKLIGTVEKCNGKTIALNRRSLSNLIRLLTDSAKKRNCALSDSDARYLIETVGDDLSILINEIDKLCFYVSQGNITRNIIDDVCIKTSEASVYDYVSEVIAGNVSSALKMLDSMLYMKVEPIYILYTVSSAYIDIYRVFAAETSGVAMRKIEDDFGYKNRAFVLTKAQNQLKRLNIKKIQMSFDILMSADKGIKSFGCEPSVLLQEMTVKLAYVAVKGENFD